MNTKRRGRGDSIGDTDVEKFKCERPRTWTGDIKSHIHSLMPTQMSANTKAYRFNQSASHVHHTELSSRIDDVTEWIQIPKSCNRFTQHWSRSDKKRFHWVDTDAARSRKRSNWHKRVVPEHSQRTDCGSLKTREKHDFNTRKLFLIKKEKRLNQSKAV